MTGGSTTHRERTFAFYLQQWLYERTKSYVMPLFPIFLMIHYNNTGNVRITCVKIHTERFYSVTSEYLSQVAKNLNFFCSCTDIKMLNKALAIAT